MGEEYIGIIYQRVRINDTLFIYKPVNIVSGTVCAYDVPQNEKESVPEDPNEDTKGYYTFLANGVSYRLLNTENQFDEEFVVGNLVPISKLQEKTGTDDLESAYNKYANLINDEVVFGTTRENNKLKVFNIENESLVNGTGTSALTNTKNVLTNVFDNYINDANSKLLNKDLVTRLYEISFNNAINSTDLLRAIVNLTDLEEVVAFFYYRTHLLRNTFQDEESLKETYVFFENALLSIRNIIKNITDDTLSTSLELLKEKLGDKVNTHIEKICRFTYLEMVRYAFTHGEIIVKKKEKTYQGLLDRLNEVVIGQEEAKKRIIVSIFKSDNDAINKNNLLLVGPSGSGKTLIAETCANYLDIPSVVVDSTTLSTPGYVGEDVDQQLVRLLDAAGGDLEKAQRGILIFDEIDKKGSKSNDDVSGRGVLNCLLGLIEGKKYQIKYRNRLVEFDTSKLKIVMTGAFAQVAEEIKKKKDEASFGFVAIDSKKKDVKVFLSDEDITTKGDMPPEFIGRVLIVNLNKLTKEEFKEILYYSEKSILRDLHDIYKKYNINLVFTEEFVDAFIEKIMKEDDGEFGARTLNKRLSELVLDAESEMILSLTSKNKYTDIIVDKDVLDDSNNITFINEDGINKKLGVILAEENERKQKAMKERKIPEFIKKKVTTIG